ncbi:MAG: retroviral-like aspartic protease family protein [Pseudomonadota bacterium]
MRYLHKIIFLALALLFISQSAFAEFQLQLPVSATKAGTFEVTGQFGASAPEQFLIDTGAAISTISAAHFKKLKNTQAVVATRSIAARLANGKYQKTKVYEISGFKLGRLCKLGKIEVAVMASGGRNIIGMDVLAKTAPFGLYLDSPSLAVSTCQQDSINDLADASTVE